MDQVVPSNEALEIMDNEDEPWPRLMGLVDEVFR